MAQYTLHTQTNQWQYVGQQYISPRSSYYADFAIAPNGDIYLACVDGFWDDKISVFKYNKSVNQWQYFGDPKFITGYASKLIIGSDNMPYLLMQAKINNSYKTAVMSYY